ncbi:MAG: hypothetical protein ACXWW6_06070, partial [Candidatus Limnocylindrales bacterium]
LGRAPGHPAGSRRGGGDGRSGEGSILMSDLVILVGIVLVGGVGGIVLGMLLAPRIGRLVERGDDATAPEEIADDREP